MVTVVSRANDWRFVGRGPCTGSCTINILVRRRFRRIIAIMIVLLTTNRCSVSVLCVLVDGGSYCRACKVRVYLRVQCVTRWIRLSECVQ